MIVNGPVAQARIEYRRPGADASPYLVAAALLAAGLHGLTETPPLPAPLGAAAAEGTPKLPNTMADALTRFEQSAHARQLLGKEFVESYLASRREEFNRYKQWQRQQVTTWELERYLEAL